MSDKPLAIVTGASSGIGAATARHLAAAGYDLILGARRLDRLREVAEPLGATALPLDVTDPASVQSFCAQVLRVNVLVNNAGGALGLEPVAEADDAKWETMYDSNVLGLMRVTRALLPQLETSGAGHIVNVTSIAAIEVYPGGAGYTAAKHAARAVTETLRLELLGKPIRVTEVAPGMVETEFSVVRFAGDKARADKTYAGMTPLTADDIADAITWAVTRPAHVNIDTLVIRPLDQATATQVHRRS
ncbi:MAG: SDR family NAD(P)-dependent oxidoreductase [Armatimonadetes bacterium]|nr:SDR family NAD(P)-dependent oxidoreductase [Armatimonadota bacterium]